MIMNYVTWNLDIIKLLEENKVTQPRVIARCFISDVEENNISVAAGYRMAADN